jgi:ADP-heptose:LPS heptosyltransferase
VVIHPFSGSAKKNWPIENYRALAERLPMPVEWVAGPEESLRDAKRLDNLLVLASWMRGCELYIGNDSGISHLAAAIGLPAVVLFGPTDPNVWAPQGDAVQILQHNPLSALAVDPVLAAAGYLSL